MNLDSPKDSSASFNGRYLAVVFDFDGTLASLTLDFEHMRQCVAEAVAGFFLDPPTPPPTPVLEWIESLAVGLNGGAGGFEAAELRRKAHDCIRQIEIEAAESGGLFGFTRPLLEALKRSGVAVGIITRNCAPAVAKAFPDAGDYVDVILTRDDVARVKPDPAHLGAALERLGCAPHAALMVGDHPLDIETGRLMGAHSAGVGSGRISTEELAAAGALHVAQDCLALCRELAKRGLLPPLDGL